MNRLPLPLAYIDPAFLRCLDGAIETTELVEQYDRLYGTSLMRKPNAVDMRFFVEHVHDVVYMRLPDEAIVGLRHVKGSQPQHPRNS